MRRGRLGSSPSRQVGRMLSGYSQCMAPVVEDYSVLTYMKMGGPPYSLVVRDFECVEMSSV